MKKRKEKTKVENQTEQTEIDNELEDMNGIDGYYFTGEVNKQTLQDNKDPVGEFDQFAFRHSHSVAENYHGPPEYTLEESWREWDKFLNDDFSKVAGPSYRDQAHEKAKKEEIRNLLEDTIEVENLSINLIGHNVFVSGRATTELNHEQITELIKSIDGIENVVNHIQLRAFSPHKGPQSIMKKDLGLEGGMYEA